MNMIRIIGKATIHPLLFYTGKAAGYITWLLLLLSLLGVAAVGRHAPSGYAFLFMAYGLLLLGLFFTIVSLVNLGRSTRLGLPAEDTALKRNGLYRLSRNPMYVGFDLITLASMAYHLNMIVAILGLYSICIYHGIILGEEKFLAERFGQAYLDYKEKVRRYI